MRKFRVFVVELVLVPLFLGWLIWKYPEKVDAVIPWILLLILWHLTWEFVLESDRAKVLAGLALRRCGRMAWVYAFVVGGLVSMVYFYSVKSSLAALAHNHPAGTASTPSEAHETPITGIEKESAPGPGAAIGVSDSVSVLVTPNTPKGGAMTGSFTTSGRGEYEVDILGVPPEELLFKPPNVVVERGKLPVDLVISGHKISVRRFTKKGFVVFDNGWRDISIGVSLVKAAGLATQPARPAQNMLRPLTSGLAKEISQRLCREESLDACSPEELRERVTKISKQIQELIDDMDARNNEAIRTEHEHQNDPPEELANLRAGQGRALRAFDNMRMETYRKNLRAMAIDYRAEMIKRLGPQTNTPDYDPPDWQGLKEVVEELRDLAAELK